MMDKFRDIAKGPVAVVLLGLVIISFAVTGVDSYLRSNGGDYVVKVNGEKITQNDWERAFELERNRLGEMYAKIVDSDEKVRQFRKNVLERLILERLSQQSVHDLGLRVSKQQLNEAIWAIPAFQVAGKFNANQYNEILRSNGLNSDSFQQNMREDIARRQLMRGISETAFTLPNEALQAFHLDAQTREIEYVQVPLEKFSSKVATTDDELKAYYDAHPETFREPEQVKLQYVELSSAALAGSLKPTDDELKAFYGEKSANYKVAGSRHVAHILVNVASDAKADDVKKAEAKIDAIQKRLKAGEDFAAVAKATSEDAGSAENGGDLDWIDQGVMDPAFDKAAFALQNKGDVSSVVRSTSGLHLIKLLDVKPERVLPYEQVKARVESDFRKSKQDAMASDFYAKRQILEEKSYEFSDSLDEVAKALNLEVKETGFITRGSGEGIAANPKVETAAFSQDVLQEHRNSEVVELSDQDALVLRVKEHKPEGHKSFDSVKAEVAKLVADEKAKKEIKALTDALLADVQAGKPLDEKLKSEGLEWKKATLQRNSFAVDAAIRDAGFRLSATGPESSKAVELGNGDRAIVHLLSVKMGDEKQFVDPGKQQLIDGLARFYGEADFRHYLDALKSSGEVVYAESSQPQLSEGDNK